MGEYVLLKSRPATCENPCATSLALYFSICPRLSLFTQKVHLHPITLTLGGLSTRSQEPYPMIMSYLRWHACNHFCESGDFITSRYVSGSSSAKTTRADSVDSRLVRPCARATTLVIRSWCHFLLPYESSFGSNQGPTSNSLGAWSGIGSYLLSFVSASLDWGFWSASGDISPSTWPSLLIVVVFCDSSMFMSWTRSCCCVGISNGTVVMGISFVQRLGRSSSSVAWIVTRSMWLDSSNMMSLAFKMVWVRGIQIL